MMSFSDMRQSTALGYWLG